MRTHDSDEVGAARVTESVRDEDLQGLGRRAPRGDDHVLQEQNRLVENS